MWNLDVDQYPTERPENNESASPIMKTQAFRKFAQLPIASPTARISLRDSRLATGLQISIPEATPANFSASLSSINITQGTSHTAKVPDAIAQGSLHSRPLKKPRLSEPDLEKILEMMDWTHSS